MQMIYNSPNYCIVEFPAQANHLAMGEGGYEVVDKNARREIFFDGVMAIQFRERVKQLMQGDSSLDEVDAFLGQFNSMMNQPVVMH